MAYPGDELKAPGILRNPVRVEALYDPAAAHEASLRNLLQRRGYADLNVVLEKGREEGGLAVVLRQLHRMVGPFLEANRQRVGQLGHDGLAALAEALLAFQTPDDLSAWLASRSPVAD